MSCLSRFSSSRSLIAPIKYGFCYFSTSGPFPSKPSYHEKFGWQIAISPSKKVSVRKWNDVYLIDIRGYFDPEKNGNMIPTKKGISLTENQWQSFVSQKESVSSVLKILKGEEKVVKKEEDKPLF